MNRAVPRAGLLHQGPASRLLLDRPSWSHLLAFLDKVERLPADLSPLSGATRDAIDVLRTALQAVGSPAGVLSIVRRLQMGAAAMAATLQRLLRSGDSLPSRVWKDALLQLGAIAQDSRSGISMVAHELRGAVPEVVRANHLLAVAFAADVDRLRQAQEALGLKALQEPQVESLRRAVAAVGAVTDEAGWVEPALGAVAEFIDQAHKAWTQVGSGVAQVAADASQEQMEDASWREDALGLQQAAAHWRAIAQAAQAFTEAVPPGWASRILHEESMT